MHTIEWSRRAQCTVEYATRKSDRIFKRLSDLYTKYPPVKGREVLLCSIVDSRHDLSPSVENGMD